MQMINKKMAMVFLALRQAKGCKTINDFRDSLFPVKNSFWKEIISPLMLSLTKQKKWHFYWEKSSIF